MRTVLIWLDHEILARFWAKVDRLGPDDCWLWTGGPSSGYGLFWIDGANEGAHRFSWMLFNQRQPPPETPFVLHRCEGRYPPGDLTYRRCVNPAHLYAGDHESNTADMVASGRSATGARHGSVLHPAQLARGDRNGSRRHPERLARGSRHGRHTHPECSARGERHGRAVLTAYQVEGIRTIKAHGFGTNRELAEMYGVSVNTIGQILRGETWQHVPSPSSVSSS